MSSRQQQRVERRLVAIMAADVVGYSRLMGEDEEGTLAALKAIRRELTEPKIAENRGRIVKTTGDGLLVEFPSVVDAVRCAVEVQREMALRNAEVPEARRIEFRIGINLGDVIIDEHDIYGDGVNVAARLEALADPGGICVSRVVRDQVRDKLDFAFEDMGDQQVKNIARPVHVWRIRLGGTTAVPSALLPMPDKPSLAVLPFQNMTGDVEQDYFVDGIVEEITTAISRLPWLFVIARNSSFTYKGRAVDVKQVARELGVRYVLEGSVRKGGDKVRITGQLIDAVTGTHLWADRFDGSLDDIFELQDEVASRVACAIELWMAGWTLSGFTSERATAKNVIDRALTLNPSSAHAWVARGLVSVFQDRPDQAIEALERAIRLNPLDPWGGRAFRSPLAMAHFAAGRYEDAIRWADRALAAQPDYRPALRIKAACSAYLDRMEEARDWLGRVLEIEPGLTITRLKALMPQFSPQLMARFAEGLRKAGLPEA